MSHAVVVPLDGSAVALDALPLALAIARAEGARLVLVRIHAPASLRADGASVDPELLLDDELYVSRIASRLRERTGVQVETVLRADGVARGIAGSARDTGAELVVMTTHGHTALTRFWLGDVARGVVRQASVPVLMVRPHKAHHRRTEAPVDDWTTPALLPRHILVPLDGSEVAETVLSHAATLGRAAEADYTLLHVVPSLRGDGPRYPTIGRILSLDAGERQVAVEHAHEYLASAAERLRSLAPGAAVHALVTMSESPSAAVLDAAQATGAGMIALTTTGHGPSRLALGTVAERLLRTTELPILVFRPQPRMVHAGERLPRAARPERRYPQAGTRAPGEAR